MENQKHPNLIKSSNLIFATAILGIFNFILLPNMAEIPLNIFIAIFTCLFIFGLGFLVRSGKNWEKYFLLVITIIGLIIGFPGMFMIMRISMIVLIINAAQIIMQIWAVILLFKIPKLES